MSVQQQIDRISGEVSDQTTLLDQALAAIASKAAGGGGSVETCTVSLRVTDPENIYPLVTYQVPNGYNLLEHDGTTTEYEFQCIAPSVVALTEMSYRTMSSSGEIEVVFNVAGNYTFYVTGNCTIELF